MPCLQAYSVGDFGLREVWMSEAGGAVILDHREIHFRPRSDGF